MANRKDVVSPATNGEGSGLLGGNSALPLGDNEPAEHVNGARFFLTKARGQEKQRLNRFFDALGGAERTGRVSPVVPHTRVYTAIRTYLVLSVAVTSFIVGAAVASFHVESAIHPQPLHEAISNIMTSMKEDMYESRQPDAWTFVPSGCSVVEKMSAQGICAVQLRYVSPEPPHDPLRARVLCRDKHPKAGHTNKPFYSDIGNLRYADILVDPHRPALGYARPLKPEHKVDHATEARYCHQECVDHGDCKAWTVWGGNCWLKSCLRGEPGCAMSWDNDGPGGHKMTNTSNHYAVWGIKGCNFITSILEHGYCKIVLADPSKIEEELDHLPWCEDWFRSSCEEVETGQSVGDPCVMRRDRPEEKVRFTSVSNLSARHTSAAERAFADAQRISHQPSHTLQYWHGLILGLVAWGFFALGIIVDGRLDRKAERRIRDFSAALGTE